MRHETHHDLTLDAVVRYAGASGDFTPIHWDTDEAAAAGYERLFAMGMLPAGWLGALVHDAFGAGTIREFRVRFCSRAWLGQRITCSAEVMGDESTDGALDVRLSATAQDGTVLVEGSARVVPRDQSPK